MLGKWPKKNHCTNAGPTPDGREGEGIGQSQRQQSSSIYLSTAVSDNPWTLICFEIISKSSDVSFALKCKH